MPLDPWRAGVDAIYDGVLGDDASLTPADGGPATAVRAVRSRAGSGQDWDPVGAPADQEQVGLRVSETDRPAPGALLAIAGDMLRVVNARLSEDRLEWLCEVEQVDG